MLCGSFTLPVGDPSYAGVIHIQLSNPRPSDRSWGEYGQTKWDLTHCALALYGVKEPGQHWFK